MRVIDNNLKNHHNEAKLPYFKISSIDEKCDKLKKVCRDSGEDSTLDQTKFRERLIFREEKFRPRNSRVCAAGGL